MPLRGRVPVAEMHGPGKCQLAQTRPVNGGAVGCTDPPLPYTREHLSIVRSNAPPC
jgi:hypothetical protein